MFQDDPRIQASTVIENTSFHEIVLQENNIIDQKSVQAINLQMNAKQSRAQENEYYDLSVMSPLITIYTISNDANQDLNERLLEKQRIINYRFGPNPVENKSKGERKLLKLIPINQNQNENYQKSENDYLNKFFPQALEKQNKMKVNNVIFTFGDLLSEVYQYYAGEALQQTPKRMVYINFSKEESEDNVNKAKNIQQCFDKQGNFKNVFYISYFQDAISPILKEQNIKQEINHQTIENLSDILEQKLQMQNNLLELIDDQTLLFPIPMFIDQLENYQLKNIIEYLSTLIQKNQPDDILCNIDIEMDTIGLQHLINMLQKLSNNKLIIRIRQNYRDMNTAIEAFDGKNVEIPDIKVTVEKLQERTVWFGQSIRLLKKYKHFDNIYQWYIKQKPKTNYENISQQLDGMSNIQLTSLPRFDATLYNSNKIFINDQLYELIYSDDCSVYIQQKSQVVVGDNLIYIHDAIINNTETHCFGRIEKDSSKINMQKFEFELPKILMPTIIIKNHIIYWIYGFKLYGQQQVFHDYIYAIEEHSYKILSRNQNNFTNDLFKVIDGNVIDGRAYPGVSHIGIAGGDITLFGGSDQSGVQMFKIIEIIKLGQDWFSSAIAKEEKLISQSNSRSDLHPLVIHIQDSFYIFPADQSITQNQFRYTNNQGVRVRISDKNIIIDAFQLKYNDRKLNNVSLDQASNRWIIQNMLSESTIRVNFQQSILSRNLQNFKTLDNQKLKIQHFFDNDDSIRQEHKLFLFQYDITIQNVNQGALDDNNRVAIIDSELKLLDI